jgi:AraC-like DNA-binding protein
MMTEKDALMDTLLKNAPETGTFSTKINGFTIARRDVPHITEICMVKPVIMVTLQGKKRSVIGQATYEYREGQSMIFGMNLPVASTVLEPSPEKPYCSMLLELDASLITQFMKELPKDGTDNQNLAAVACSETDSAVLEAFTRLAYLLHTPEHIKPLAPLIISEIHYRLLISPLGKHIRELYFFGTQSNQIARAISWLQNNYKVPLKVEDLATHVNMGISTFHRNFKVVTSLSPLQYQKKLRLLEAQRIMLTEGADVISASYEVGYESPTQFNREYKRMFGNSPKKDIKNMS